MSTTNNPTQDKKVLKALSTINDERKQKLLLNLLTKGSDASCKKFVEDLVPRTKEEAILKSIPIAVDAPVLPPVQELKKKVVPISSSAMHGTTGAPLDIKSIKLSGTGSTKQVQTSLAGVVYTGSSPHLYACKFDKINGLINTAPGAAEIKNAVFIIPVTPGTQMSVSIYEAAELSNYIYGFVSSTDAPANWRDVALMGLSADMSYGDYSANVEATIPSNANYVVVSVYRSNNTAHTTNDIKSRASSIFFKKETVTDTGKMVTKLKNSNGVTTASLDIVTDVAPCKKATGSNYLKVEGGKLKFVQELVSINRDPAATAWTAETITGTTKMMLEYASCGAYKDNIYIIGGLTDGGNIMLVYNTVTKAVTKRDIGMAVVGCAAVVVGKYMYIFGGHYGSNALTLTIGQCTKSNKAYRIDLDSPTAMPEAIATFPSIVAGQEAKFFGAGATYWKGKICLVNCETYMQFGTDYNSFSALHCYDIATNTWQRNVLTGCWATELRPLLIANGDVLNIVSWLDMTGNITCVQVKCVSDEISASTVSMLDVSISTTGNKVYIGVIVGGKTLVGAINSSSSSHTFYELTASGTLVVPSSEITAIAKAAGSGTGVLATVNGVAYNIYSTPATAASSAVIKVSKLKTGGEGVLSTPVVTDVSTNTDILQAHKFFTSLYVDNDILDIEGNVEVYDI